jgi:hypothetical protein
MAPLLLSCMLAGAMGPSIRDAAYQSWSVADESFFGSTRFANRVDVALANPFATGNGGPAIQGVNTTLAGSDTGGGLCTDSAGAFANLCPTIGESLIWSTTQSFSAAGPTAALSLSADATGPTPFNITNNASPTGVVPLVKFTAGGSDCTTASTNMFLAIVSAGTPGLQFLCNGNATDHGSFTQIGNGNNLVYGSHLAGNANCGTAASPQATGSTCNGDMGYVQSSAAPAASITLGTAYTAGNATCQAWDNAAPTTLVAVTNAPTTTVAITSPTNAHVYFWHCWAFNGG